MKTFKDLIFEPRKIGGYQAVLNFENGYGVSVLFGDIYYSDGVTTYELAVLQNGHLCYDTPITSDVLGYIYQSDITAIMQTLQNYDSV